MKKSIFLFLMLSVSVTIAYPQQESPFTIHAAPEAEIPLPLDNQMFNTGAGIELSFEYRMPFWSVLGIQADVAYGYLPLKTGDGVNFINGGGGLGFTLPRIGGVISPSFFANAGYYYGIIADNDASSGGNIYFSGGGRLAWVLSPNFNIGLDVRYKNYLNGLGGILHHGINAGINLSFNFHDTGRVIIDGSNFLDIFPVQYKYYSDHSIGSITVHNPGAVPIDDVHVSLFIEKYMDNPTVSSGPVKIDGGGSADIPLFALFSENALNITESTLVSAELQVNYVQKGDEKSESFSETIRIHDRHAMTWDYTAKAAAFVNYKDPSVIRIGKMLSHLVKSTVNVVDVNLCTAVAVHQALNAYGIEYVIDPTSPFTEFSGDAMAVDYIQFPSNTLEFKSGDCDDLSILYTAVLQSVGIDTAFITVPGHIFIAFALKTPLSEIRKALSTPDDLIEYDGRAWIPLEITMVANPFMQAWKAGANQWNEFEQTGEAAIMPMSRSWQTWEPVGFASFDGDFIADDSAESAYLAEIESFIKREIFIQTEPLHESINRRGENARNLNRMGAVYARYGRNTEAMEYFSKALQYENYYPAIVNIGNLLLLENDLQGALEKYREAERLNDRSAALYLQMSRAYGGLGMFDMAAESFDQVKQKNPELAERYAFIDTGANNSRASGYSLTDGMVWIDQEE